MRPSEFGVLPRALANQQNLSSRYRPGGMDGALVGGFRCFAVSFNAFFRIQSSPQNTRLQPTKLSSFFLHLQSRILRSFWQSQQPAAAGDSWNAKTFFFRNPTAKAEFLCLFWRFCRFQRTFSSLFSFFFVISGLTLFFGESKNKANFLDYRYL